jgi:hypothetical protein
MRSALPISPLRSFAAWITVALVVSGCMPPASAQEAGTGELATEVQAIVDRARQDLDVVGVSYVVVRG